ncbi:hypothetical protein EBB07_22775 [Paenibacillaceae bacterium]|nr:hypothetical protein EBB07_22775 [Paenibacillaceae bacterium]
MTEYGIKKQTTNNRRKTDLNLVFRKMLMMGMAMLLLITSVVFALTPRAHAQQADIGNHWAKQQLQAWMEKGFISGYADGTFRPNQPITRAEWMKLVNRLFGYDKQGDTFFVDVHATDWFSSDVSAAARAGYISGYADGTMRPNHSLTREEAAVILSRLGQLRDDIAAADRFTDSIAAWSRGSVGAVAVAGLMSGYPDGTFSPANPLTRAEAVVTLERLLAFRTEFAASKPQIPRDIDEAGIYGPTSGSETIKGDLTISKPGVTLQNTVITGNLTLAKSIGEGDISLQGITVQGELQIYGGGINSIYVTDSNVHSAIVDKEDGKVRVAATGSTTIALTTLQSAAVLEEKELTGSGFESVNLSRHIPAQSVVQLSGEYDEVRVDASGIQLVLKTGHIETLEISESVTDTIVELAAGTTIGTAIIYGKVTFTGSGKVQVKKGPGLTSSGFFYFGGSAPDPKPEQPPDVIRIDHEPESIVISRLGATLPITLTAQWSDGASSDITSKAAWSSDDEAIATVEEGVVTALGVGTTEIVAEYGNRTARIPVTVDNVSDAHKVLVSADSVSPEAGAANAVHFVVKRSNDSIDTDFSGMKKVTVTGVSEAPDGSFGSWDEAPISGMEAETQLLFDKGEATASLSLHHATSQTLAFTVEDAANQAADLMITPKASSAAQLIIETEPSGAVDEQELAIQPVIRIADAYGNLANASNAVTAAVSRGSATLSGTTEVNAVNGVAAFTDLLLTGADMEVILSFTSPGLSETDSSPFPVNPFTSGRGTVDEPYVIMTAKQLDNVRNNLSAHFILGEDIHLNPAPDHSGSGWLPIGTLENAFTGKLDGDGHTVYGLTMNRPASLIAGLFGSMTGDAKIFNIGLEDVNVIGTFNVGALVGFMQGGSIEDAYAEGRVESRGASQYTGGLVGRMGRDTVISRSYANTHTIGSLGVGGLVGVNEGTIIQSYAAGKVNSNFQEVGGLVGINLYAIRQSYALTDIEGATQFIGGLVGHNKGMISDTYAAGSINSAGISSIGGLIGFDALPGLLARSFYDQEKTGQNDSFKGTPLTSAQMKEQVSYTGWDFDTVWGINTNNYPYLRWQQP